MMTYEVSNRRTTDDWRSKEINQIENWFRFEYPQRLNAVNRYAYLGIDAGESRYTIEIEAYKKENRLRELKGLEPLPELKFKKII